MENTISQFLRERIDAGDFPSAVYLIAEKGEIVLRDAVGYAVVEPEKLAAKIDTIYDLASLTKVLVTGLLAAKLIENRELDFEGTVSSVLPEFNDQSKGKIKIRHLLTHTSGMKAWVPFYLLENRKRQEQPRDTVLRVMSGEPTAGSPGDEVIYSDPNFLILEMVIEAVRRSSLSDLAAREIIDPLDLYSTFFNPPTNRRLKIAASEFGNSYERKTCQDLGYFDSFLDPQAYKTASEEGIDVMAYKWRDYQIWGEVHDGNAWFLGGAAGHAGLFSTAEEVFKVALQFLPNYTTLLKLNTCALFRTNFTKGMKEDRSFAFQLASTPESTSGKWMRPESFGHLGFTGTSLWIDPVKERIFVLLTNRTHHHALPFANGNAARRHFHDLGVEFLEKK